MGFFSKIKESLSRTKQNISDGLNELFSNFRKVDEEFLEELEEILLLADVGFETAEKIIEELRHTAKLEKIENAEVLKERLVQIITEMMSGGNELNINTKPSVIIVVGVNGVGKTTTIGKLASRLKNSGKKVVLGAADTFRAAAVDQLVIWSERAGVPIVKQGMGADPASVAFDTLKSAVAQDADVVLIDTAGRLHNKINLMNELTKIRNVMRKVVPDAPHEVLLVLDGSTGQNAYQQAKEFTKATDVTALAVTKLDGTAKGGVVIGISDQFQIPVKFIGVGEKIEDLQVFDKKEFVASLFKN